jgi:hypothetical protein
MLRLRFSILLIAGLFITIIENKAQDEKFKSIFIYNFTKLIEWPADKQYSEFIITIYGNNPGIMTELQSLATKMKVANKQIVIKQAIVLSQVTNSNILFICKEKTADLPGYLDDLEKNHILVISDKPYACDLGSCINFINKSGSLAFEICPQNLEKSGLIYSNQLLSLGTVVKK